MNESDGAVLNGFSLYVSAQGCVRLDERWRREGVCDPFTRLYFVKEGTGYLLPAHAAAVPLAGGYAYCIPAGCTFAYGCTRLEKIYFHINVNAEDGDLFRGAGRIGAMPFSAEEYAALERALGSADPADGLYVKGVLYAAAARFGKELLAGKGVRRYSDAVRAALRLIRGDPRIDRRAGEIAQSLFVSESKLRKDFRSETGVTLRRYSEEQTLARAKALLAGGSLSVDEISERLGYCDRFHFTRRFSAAFGISPAAYRSAASYRGGKGG